MAENVTSSEGKIVYDFCAIGLRWFGNLFIIKQFSVKSNKRDFQRKNSSESPWREIGKDQEGSWSSVWASLLSQILVPDTLMKTGVSASNNFKCAWYKFSERVGLSPKASRSS